VHLNLTWWEEKFAGFSSLSLNSKNVTFGGKMIRKACYITVLTASLLSNAVLLESNLKLREELVHVAAHYKALAQDAMVQYEAHLRTLGVLDEVLEENCLLHGMRRDGRKVR
jgi:glycyl-tRNA synthetase (class II)